MKRVLLLGVALLGAVVSPGAVSSTPSTGWALAASLLGAGWPESTGTSPADPLDSAFDTLGTRPESGSLGADPPEPVTPQTVTPQTVTPQTVIPQAVPPPRPLPSNPRALWVVRDALLSPQKIRRMVADAHEGGITDLFVQVRGRADAYYISDLTGPPAPLEDAWRRHGRYDPLALVLDLAHAQGLRVHAWLNVYLVWSGTDPPLNHVIRKHPEWVAVAPDGMSMLALSRRRLEAAQTEGIYLEPGNGEVLSEFLSVVTELLDRYPVDGVHLDYVRYPGLEVGYSEAMRVGFEDRTGIDPIRLAGPESRLVRELGLEQALEVQREWRRFKADQVTALVREVRKLTLAHDPAIFLSAAVRPDPAEAFQVFGQDWVRWLNEGLIDVAAPMMYSTSRSRVERQARELAQVVPGERVWAGIAVYNQSLSAAQAKILSCLRLGLGGICIFSYNALPGGANSLNQLHRGR